MLSLNGVIIKSVEVRRSARAARVVRRNGAIGAVERGWPYCRKLSQARNVVLSLSPHDALTPMRDSNSNLHDTLPR